MKKEILVRYIETKKITIDTDNLVVFFKKYGWENSKFDPANITILEKIVDLHLRQLLIPKKAYSDFEWCIQSCLDKFSEIEGVPIKKIIEAVKNKKIKEN